MPSFFVGVDPVGDNGIGLLVTQRREFVHHHLGGTERGHLSVLHQIVEKFQVFFGCIQRFFAHCYINISQQYVVDDFKKFAGTIVPVHDRMNGLLRPPSLIL